MAKYKRTAITAKVGLNYVRSIVEAAGCLFHKIEQENDLGIDALIELVRGEQPLNKMIGIQVKSGPTYFNSQTKICSMPVDNHREYWLKYCVSVIGIVYVPALDAGYWINIQAYLERNPVATAIQFPANQATRFAGDSFATVFVPLAMHEVPSVPLDEALRLFRSDHADERYLGLKVLFGRYRNEIRAWDAYVDFFSAASAESIPPVLIYYLAHIPWHGDIAGWGEIVTKDTREHVRQRMSSFGKSEILKLLSFIDEDNVISRGSIGQSVEAIVSSLPNSLSNLEDIARDLSTRRFCRECAALIVGMHQGRAAIPLLANVAKSGSSYAEELIAYLKEHGELNPYS
jgi:uncharacterized protein DUF4365